MKYWDSSALVALHVDQAATRSVRALYSGDSEAVTWVLSEIEMRSALHRLGREGHLSAADLAHVLRQIATFHDSLVVITPVEPVKVRARRLLGVHELRSADALQLGAALLSVDDDPAGQDFVCLDARLSEAARREGFHILP